MAEKIFDAQNNYGWGLTLNMTGKAPAISKRIFNTLADAQAFADDYNDSAIEGIILSVVADEESKNGIYHIRSIKNSIDDTPSVLVKVGDVDMTKMEEYVNGEIEKLADADKAIMNVITENETVIAQALTNLNDKVVANTDSISETQKEIESITINGQTIVSNPVLNSDDFLIGDNYSILNQPANNIFPGDLLTSAISKLEVMLANTTLSVTAALNDLDSRLGNATSFDTDGTKHEATGLYKKFEDLEFIVRQLEYRLDLLEGK